MEQKSVAALISCYKICLVIVADVIALGLGSLFPLFVVLFLESCIKLLMLDQTRAATSPKQKGKISIHAYTSL